MTEQWTAEASTLLREAPKPLTQIEIDQRVFDLYDEYCHGHIDRREFLQRAAAVSGFRTAAHFQPDASPRSRSAVRFERLTVRIPSAQPA